MTAAERKILIVDDSSDCRLLMQKYLGKAGFDCIEYASSAAEAMERVSAMPWDLVLLDVMMPDSDGISTCRAIKENDHMREVPVVMVTASEDVSVIEKAFSVGAVDYIRKPLERMELLARVQSVLRLKDEMDRRKAREEELMEVTRRLEEANTQLRLLSSTDGVTGIANRRHFEDMLQREWRRAHRHGKPLSLVLLDIDFFKKFNDTYGHPAGDSCLRKVAKTLAAEAKRPADVAARYGGEEFAVLLPETPLEGALQVAEEMRQAVAALGILHAGSEISGTVTISAGVATILPRGSKDVRHLVKGADTALYRAKHEGRNRIAGDVILTPEAA